MADSPPSQLAHDPAWQRLKELVAAASRRDADVYAQLGMRFSTEVPLDGQRRAGVYLWCALQYRVKELLHREPNAADLQRLASQSYPSFREVLCHADEIHLEEALRRSLEFQPVKVGLTPGEFLLFGSTALAVLLADAERDMETIRPSLEIWWRRNESRLGSLGVSGGDRS